MDRSCILPSYRLTLRGYVHIWPTPSYAATLASVSEHPFKEAKSRAAVCSAPPGRGGPGPCPETLSAKPVVNQISASGPSLLKGLGVVRTSAAYQGTVQRLSTSILMALAAWLRSGISAQLCCKNFPPQLSLSCFHAWSSASDCTCNLAWFFGQ